jgi:hypothetical protein
MIQWMDRSAGRFWFNDALPASLNRSGHKTAVQAVGNMLLEFEGGLGLPGLGIEDQQV